MSISPEDAARALSGIRGVQEQAIRSEPFFPVWFTVGVALFATGISFFTEPGTSPATTATGIAVLAVALAAMVFRLARGARMRTHHSLIRPETVSDYVCWVLVSVAVALAVALPLNAREVAYAGVQGCPAMTVFMAATGPLIARWMSRRTADAIRDGD